MKRTATVARVLRCEPADHPLNTPGLERLTPELVIEAAEYNNQILDDIADPGTGSGYRSPGFEFIQYLLGAVPELRNMDPADALDAIEVCAAAAHRAGRLPHSARWPPNMPLTAAVGDETSYDRYNGLDEGSTAPLAEEGLLTLLERFQGEGLLAAAVAARTAEATAPPDRYGAAFTSHRYAPRRVFLDVCFRLAAKAEDGTFPIAQTAFGRVLGVPQRTISDWVRWALQAEFLELFAAAASYGHVAATYRLGPRGRLIAGSGA